MIYENWHNAALDEFYEALKRFKAPAVHECLIAEHGNTKWDGVFFFYLLENQPRSFPETGMMGI
jgi:hypothetical protein